MTPARVEVAAAVAVVVSSAALSVVAPVWTYAGTLALFGVPHVLAELRYLDSRFGARVTPRVVGALWVGLLGIVALRAAALLGVGEVEARGQLEFLLGAALCVCLLPTLAARGRGAALAGAVALAAGIGAASVRPLEALVWFAVVHNLTPVGLLAEATRGAVRRRAMAVCAVVFGVVPLVIVSGLPARLAGSSGLGFSGPFPLDAHLGVFVAPSLAASPYALDVFRAAAFLQCMHYAAVLHVLPRLGGQVPFGRLCWPAWGVPRLAVALAVAGATLGFALAFRDTRLVYGLFAAVHAWLEVPVLLLAASAASPSPTSSRVVPS